MAVPTLMPVYLFRMMHGMSIPPVAPPALTMMPIPMPSSTPAAIAASSGSSTRWWSCSMSWNSARNKGKLNAPTATDNANLLPSTTKPARNSTTVTPPTTTGMSHPNK